jgi:DNA polymerase-1
MLTALIDADILAYQAAISSETSVHWGDGLWTLHAYEDDAKAHFDSILDNIKDATKCDHAILAFSDKENWRKAILPSYKSNRANVRKPMLLPFLREYADKKYKCFVREELEGDDVLGILATDEDLVTGNKVVCSIDKDFNTIPGRHYNFKHNEFFFISPPMADYYHMLQTLTGDSTDGYSGCPGCGPVKAKKLLEPMAEHNFESRKMWDVVVKAYDKAGLNEEEALTQARVARICRAEDYDRKSKKVNLWEPPVTDKSPEAITA